MTSGLTIVSRKEWGAEDIKDPLPINLPVSIILHTYTDTNPCYTKEDCIKAVKDLHQAHIKEGYPDLKQNFLIGGDGNIYEGRGWVCQPEFRMNHVQSWENCIEISHFGHSGMPPNIVMVTAENFINHGVKQKYIKKKYSCEMFFYPDPNDQGADSPPKDMDEETRARSDPMSERKQTILYH